MKKIYTFITAFMIISAFVISTVSSCKKENELKMNPSNAKVKPHLKATMIYTSDMLVLDSAGAYGRIKSVTNDLKGMDSSTSYNFLADTTLGLDTAFQKLDGEAIYKASYYYHINRLNDINNERDKYSFCSLQSLADEINSLMVTDSGAAKSLYSTYAELLVKTDYGVETIADPVTSQLLNLDGYVQIGDNIYKYDKDYVKIITDGKTEKIPYLDTATVSNEDYKIVVKANKFMTTPQNQNGMGIAPYNASDPAHKYVITWHTGIYQFGVGDNSWKGYIIGGSWVKYQNSSLGYFLFPSVIQFYHTTVRTNSLVNWGGYGLDNVFNYGSVSWNENLLTNGVEDGSILMDIDATENGVLCKVSGGVFVPIMSTGGYFHHTF